LHLCQSLADGEEECLFGLANKSKPTNTNNEKTKPKPNVEVMNNLPFYINKYLKGFKR
jgi:hypothetical protein